MIANPSIAFNEFSGSAKGVTARFTKGRTLLSVRSYPTGLATAAQLVSRNSLNKISPVRECAAPGPSTIP